MTVATTTKTAPRKRVPAAERRDALIEAAVHHFAHGGLQGTKVSAIAADVGVAQPYVFSLFPTKRDLFLAAVERCFEKVSALFEAASEAFDRERPAGTGRRQAEGDRPRLHGRDGRQPRPAAAPAPGLRRLRRRRGDPDRRPPQLRAAGRTLPQPHRRRRRATSTASSRWACGATSPPPSASRTSRPNQAGSRSPSPSSFAIRWLLAASPRSRPVAEVKHAAQFTQTSGSSMAWLDI